LQVFLRAWSAFDFWHLALAQTFTFTAQIPGKAKRKQLHLASFNTTFALQLEKQFIAGGLSI